MNELLVAVMLTTAPIVGPTPGTLASPTTGPLASPTTAPLAAPATSAPFIPPPFPQPYNQPGAPFGLPPPDQGSIRNLDEENVARHKKMFELYRARKRMLVESEEWRYGSLYERRSRLRELNREYRQRAQWMRDDYRSKRRELERGV
jgi:hypothetical protein